MSESPESGPDPAVANPAPRDLSAADPAPTSLQFLCPRCGGETEARYYGPCQQCSETLQATYLQSTKDVVAPEYEPKMNVTPNAVATKE